jgi:hypothetical protein
VVPQLKRNALDCYAEVECVALRSDTCLPGPIRRDRTGTIARVSRINRSLTGKILVSRIINRVVSENERIIGLRTITISLYNRFLPKGSFLSTFG